MYMPKLLIDCLCQMAYIAKSSIQTFHIRWGAWSTYSTDSHWAGYMAKLLINSLHLAGHIVIVLINRKNIKKQDCLLESYRIVWSLKRMLLKRLWEIMKIAMQWILCGCTRLRASAPRRSSGASKTSPLLIWVCWARLSVPSLVGMFCLSSLT